MTSRRRRLVVLAVVSGLISTCLVTGTTAALAQDSASLSMSVAEVRTENYVVAIDVTGTNAESGYFHLLLGPDNGKPCGPTIGTWYGEEPQPYGDGYKDSFFEPGSFSMHFDEQVQRQSGFYDEAGGGFLKACAYLFYHSDVGDKYREDVTPRATASAYHISSVVPCPPQVDFTIDEAVQLSPISPGNGLGAMRVTIPEPGYVSIAGDDHQSEHEGPFEAGTHWKLLSGPDSAKEMFKEQKSRTEQFTVSYWPDSSKNDPNRICLKPDDTFVDRVHDPATRSTSIEWRPGRTQCQFGEFGCPAAIISDCFAAMEMTCYERTLTLKLTKKAWSGTIKETGGGSHCWGIGEDPAWVSLWRLVKGTWFQIEEIRARNGTFSGKLTRSSYVTSQMKKGGTFQATIHEGANRGSDYTCSAEMSNLKKLPPG